MSEPALPYALPDLADSDRVARAEAMHRLLAARRTCRDFAPDPVPRAVIEHAIRAAGTAPSGANHQPWHFAVIGSLETKRAIRLAAEEEERAFYVGKASENGLPPSPRWAPMPTSRFSRSHRG